MKANGSHNGKLPLQMSDERNKGFDIGAVLRRARAEKGLSLEEVEEATKIRTRYLEGLEQEDYDLLPDAVYVRGFLKTYADFLGLDDEELIRELRRQQTGGHEPYYMLQTPRKDEFEEPMFQGDEFASSPRRSSSSGPRVFGGTALLLAVAVLVFLAGILYFIGRGSQSVEEANPPSGNGGQAAVSGEGAKDQSGQPSGGQASGEESPEQPQQDQPAPRPSEDQPAPPASESGSEEPPAPPPETLEAKVTVQGNISWLEITVDGTTEMAQVARPGFSRTFEGEEEISINTGNAGAVRVEVNGQDVGLLGESGQVTTRKFTLKSAAEAGA